MGSGDGLVPVGQKRLTNIAIVRLKKSGVRFELACYKNKVVEWRQGVEKDIDEVLQTTQVFGNVGKGLVAKPKDLVKAFGTPCETTEDMENVAKIILKKGELQVSDKERAKKYDSLFHEVAMVVVEKCVNPGTGRPYPAGVVERAMRDAHFNVDPNKSAKQQAMDLVPVLAAKFPLARAAMRLRLVLNTGGDAKAAATKVEAIGEAAKVAAVATNTTEGSTSKLVPSGGGAGGVAGGASADGGRQPVVIESVDANPVYPFLIVRCDPHLFGQLDALASGLTPPGRLEVVTLVVHDAAADGMGLEDAMGGVSVSAGTAGPALVAAGHELPAADYTVRQVKKSGLSCVACKCDFETREQHREHFKCDWHRANLKRKSKKQPSLSKEEYDAEAMMADQHDVSAFDAEFR